jgi:hypothetical protein
MLRFFKAFLYVSVFIFFQLLKDVMLFFLPGDHQLISFDCQKNTDLTSKTKARKRMLLQ